MSKGARIRRGKQQHGDPLPVERAGMSHEASLIAISEMTGIPAEDFCNWAVIGWSRAGNGSHHMSLISPCLMTSGSDYHKLVLLLEKALSDARYMAKVEGS